MPNSKPLADAALSWVPMAALRRWDLNPRKHPESQITALAGLMRRVGFVNPVVVWPSRDRLVSGHGRLDAVELIERETPNAALPNAPGPGMVRVLSHEFASEADATAYALADNRLPELAEDDAAAVAALAGFDDGPGDLIAVQEVDVSTLAESRFWLSVTGPLPAQPDAIEALRARLEQIPGAVVVFGSG